MEWTPTLGEVNRLIAVCVRGLRHHAAGYHGEKSGYESRLKYLYEVRDELEAREAAPVVEAPPAQAALW